MMSRRFDPSMRWFHRQSVPRRWPPQELGDPDRGVGWIARMVVPDKRQPALRIDPATSARHSGCAPGMAPICGRRTPAPVVERASDLVAFDGALGQVAAHVPGSSRRDFQVPRGNQRTQPAWCRTPLPSNSPFATPRQYRHAYLVARRRHRSPEHRPTRVGTAYPH